MGAHVTAALDDDLDFAALVDPALAKDPAAARAAAFAGPEKPYLSNQIGCSELAPLMIALGTEEGMPPRVLDWMKTARERASYGLSKTIPAHLKSPTWGGPVWCATNARKVNTAHGPMAYCLATKAGVRERDERKEYQQAGLDLEPKLWRRWVDSMRNDDGCALDVDSLRSQHDVLAMYPSRWAVRAPSVRHPEETRLVTYLDGWGRDVVGEDIVVNAKLSRDWKDEPDVPAWIQMQGEIACTRAALGVLVYGQRWNADYLREPPEERPVSVFPIEPDEGAERACLVTVAKAFEHIDSVRAQMVTKGRAA